MSSAALRILLPALRLAAGVQRGEIGAPLPSLGARLRASGVGAVGAPGSLPKLLNSDGATRTNSSSQGVQQCANTEWKRDPVIIGGVSDAGTRGVLSVLVDCFGMAACDHAGPDTGDDLVVLDTIERLWQKLGPTVSRLGKPASSLDSDDTLTDIDNSFTYTLRGARWADKAGRSLCQAVKQSWQCGQSGHLWHSSKSTPAVSEEGLWGFKVPRTGVMVAVWDLIMPSHKFVHVTRDPRSTCHLFSNHVSFDKMCSSIFAGDPRCNRMKHSYSLCYLYWGRFNLYIHNFYHRNPTRSQRYVLAPIEDVVGAGPDGAERQVKLFHLLRDRLGVNTPPERIESMMREEAEHKSKMENAAKKAPPSEWKEVLEDSDFRHALCTFGYSAGKAGRLAANQTHECQGHEIGVARP